MPYLYFSCDVICSQSFFYNSRPIYMVMLLGKSADQACVTKVIVIVIEYLYSAT